jgi:hypothetical protein
MVDFTTTQAQAEGGASSANREGSQTEATVTKNLSALPSPTTNRVDMMYHQMAEIHVITTVQLAECARWRQSDPTSSPVRAETGWQRVAAEPSAATMAPPPPNDISPQIPSW